jgi:hypothetical protein
MKKVIVLLVLSALGTGWYAYNEYKTRVFLDNINKALSFKGELPLGAAGAATLGVVALRDTVAKRVCVLGSGNAGRDGADPRGGIFADTSRGSVPRAEDPAQIYDCGRCDGNRCRRL